MYNPISILQKAVCCLERNQVGGYYPSPSTLLLSQRKSPYQLSYLHENTSNASKVLWLPTSNYKLQNTNFGVSQSENQCAALMLTGGHWISISLSASSLVQFPVPELCILFNIYIYTMYIVFCFLLLSNISYQKMSFLKIVSILR